MIDFGESVKGLYWRLKECDERVLMHFSQKLNISEILAKILVGRGITSVEEAESFLNPKLKGVMPNPFALKDIDKAVERIIAAIEKKEKIVIYGDYDVDGATSSALMYRFFRIFEVDVSIYVPSRLSEGYGPNTEAFKTLKEQGAKLIITVDCGTVSYEPLSYARCADLDVIVIDHHIGDQKLPDAAAIINPNRMDENFPEKSIAAVGVAFFVIVAVKNQLKQNDFFQKSNIEEPDLINFLDLVALGTVCDVMPLRGINRVFVAHGLKLISKRKNPGVVAIMNLLDLNGKVKASHLGYSIGPRINAGGRIGQGILGAKLLATASKYEAENIAMELEALNQERKQLESAILEEALAKIKQDNTDDTFAVFVVGEDWHLGVLGILASRIKEIYKKPTVVISIIEGIGKGSTRSIAGLDIGSAVASAKDMGLLIQGGGHAMAAGFSIKVSNITKFQAFLNDYFSKKSDAHLSFAKAKEVGIDAVISIPAVTKKLYNDLSKAEPYGSGNAQPRFAIQKVAVVKAWVVGEVHIVIIIKDEKIMNVPNTLKCVFFHGLDTKIGKSLLKGLNQEISILGYVQANSLNHDKVDFIVEDIAIY